MAFYVDNNEIQKRFAAEIPAVAPSMDSANSREPFKRFLKVLWNIAEQGSGQERIEALKMLRDYL